MNLAGVKSSPAVENVKFEASPPSAHQGPSRLVQMDPVSSRNGHDMASGTVSSVEYDAQTGQRTYKAAFRFEVDSGASRVTFKKMDGTTLAQFNEDGAGGIVASNGNIQAEGGSVALEDGGQIFAGPGGVQYASKEENGRFVQASLAFNTGALLPLDVSGLKVEAKEIKRVPSSGNCAPDEAGNLPTHLCSPEVDVNELVAGIGGGAGFGYQVPGAKSDLVFGQQEFVSLASVDKNFKYGSQQVSDYNQYQSDSAAISEHQNGEWSSESWGWFGSDYKGSLALAQFSAEAPKDWA